MATSHLNVRFTILLAALLLLPSSPASADDGDLFYGPQGRLKIQALAADTATPAFGPAPAEAIQRLLEPRQSFLDTTYRRTSSALGFDFDYTFGPTQPDPHPGINWPFWTGMFQETTGTITDRIMVLTLAWLANGDVEARDKATEMVLDLAQWEVWSDPEQGCLAGPACLDLGYIAGMVAFHYDAVRTSLDPASRATMRDALINKALVPLSIAVAEAATGEPGHNIVAVTTSGLGVAAAAVLGEDDRAEVWLNMALVVAERFLEFQDPNGAMLESHGYGALGLDFTVKLLQVASNVGHDVPDLPLLQSVSSYYASALAPDGEELGTFGDSWSDSGGASMFFLAARGDRVAQAYLIDSGQIWLQDIFWAGWADGDLAPQPYGPYPYAAPFVGVGALRSDPGPTETLLVFKSGPRDIHLTHNQKDHLSYQLWHWGEWVTGDAGYAIETMPPERFQFFENGIGHNSILIDGEGPQRKHGATLQRWAGGRGYGILCGEATGTYPALTVSHVGRCVALHPWGFAVAFDEVDAPGVRDVSLIHHPHMSGETHVDEQGGHVGTARARLDVRLPAADWVPEEVDFARSSGIPTTLSLTRVAADGTDVPVTNAGFESGDLGGWSPRYVNSSHTVDSATSASGAFSAKITFADPTSGGYLYSPFIDVDVNTLLRLTTQIRTSHIKGVGARIRAMFFDGSTYHSGFVSERETALSGWHVKSIIGTVPLGANRLRFVFEMSGAGTAWIDDATVTVVDATPADLTSVRTATLLYPAANLDLLNGDFSAGMTHWTPRYGDDSHTIDDTVFRSPPASARQHFTTTGGGYYYSPIVGAEPDQTIVTSAWLKTDNVGGSGARLRLLFYSAAGYLDQARTVEPPVTGTNDWLQRTISAVAPAGTTGVRVSVELSGTGTAWFDDIVVPDDRPVPSVSQTASPVAVEGGQQTLTFERNDTPYTVGNATDGPLDVMTAHGRLTLDDGFVLRAGDTEGTLVAIDAAAVSFDDGLALAADRPASLRVDWSATGADVERGVASDGSSAGAVMLRLPASMGSVPVTVDGEYAWLTEDAGQAVGCSAAFDSGPCAIRPDALTLIPADVSLVAGQSTPLTATVRDQYGDVLPESAVNYAVSAAAGTVSGAVLSAGQTAGSYPQALQASAGDATASADVVIIAAAPANLGLSAPTSVAAGAAFTVNATLADTYGNDAAGEIAYEAGAGASHIAGPSFVAARLAGTYAEATSASHAGLSAVAGIIVVPDEAAALDVGSTHLTLSPGGTAPLTGTTADVYGNLRGDAVNFLVTNRAAGTVVANGASGAMLTASTTAGAYPGAIRADGAGGLTEDISVTIAPGPVTQVTLSVPADVVAGDVFQVAVSAVDAHGNDAADAVSWSANAAAEHLGDGWFRAPATSDVYAAEIEAVAGDISAASDLTVIPAKADHMVVTPTNIEAEVVSTATLSAVVVDVYGNERADEPAWTANPVAGSIGAVTGGTIEWTAGVTPGTFADALTVNAAGMSVTVTATITAGPAAGLTITAPDEVAAGAVFQASGAVTDAQGNTLSDGADWSSAAATSLGDGWFRAPTEVGSYPGTLVAEHVTGSASHSLTVVAAEAAALSIGPDQLTLSPGGAATLSGMVADSYGNVRLDAISFVLVDAAAGTVVSTGASTAMMTASTAAGAYPAAIRVDGSGLSKEVSVTIIPGPTVQTTLSLPAEVVAGDVFQVIARTVDAYANDTAAAVTWAPRSVAEHLGDGWFRAPVTAAVYIAEIEAAAGAVSAAADLTVVPAKADHIAVTPARIEAEVASTVTLSATVVDGYGNDRADTVAWTANPAAGSIDVGTGPNVEWTAGTTAGTFADALTVDAAGLSVTLAATITSGPVAQLAITAPDGVAAGAVFQATVAVTDAQGNMLSDGVDWSSTAATSLGDGWFRAPTEVGSYPGALVAERATVSGSHDLTVVAAEGATLTVTPNAANMMPGESVQFSASLTDAFGNAIAGSTALTVALPEAGTIAADGTFQAGDTPGTYVDAVMANAAGLEAFATVVVDAPPVVDPPIITEPTTGDDSGGGCQSGQAPQGLVVLLALAWLLFVVRRKSLSVAG